MSVTVIVRFVASADAVDAVRSMLEAGRTAGLAAHGCEDLQLLESTSDPSAFLFIERWSSTLDHSRHRNEVVLHGPAQQRLLSLLVEPPTSEVYSAAT